MKIFLKQPVVGKQLISYLAEVIVIVTGITLSFLFDEWKQDLEKRKAEKIHLENIIQNLQGDIDYLRGEMDNMDRAIVRLTALSQHSDSSFLSKDSINSFVHELWNHYELHPINTEYELLKSTGQLNLLTNREIATDLINLYEIQFDELEFAHQITTYIPQNINWIYLMKNFNFKDDPLIRYKPQPASTDHNKLFSSTEFNNMVLFTRSGIDFTRKRYIKTIEKCRKLKAKIENELKKF